MANVIGLCKALEKSVTLVSPLTAPAHVTVATAIIPSFHPSLVGTRGTEDGGRVLPGAAPVAGGRAGLAAGGERGEQGSAEG